MMHLLRCWYWVNGLIQAGRSTKTIFAVLNQLRASSFINYHFLFLIGRWKIYTHKYHTHNYQADDFASPMSPIIIGKNRTTSLLQLMIAIKIYREYLINNYWRE